MLLRNAAWVQRALQAGKQDGQGVMGMGVGMGHGQ